MKRQPHRTELWHRIDEVLHYVWDPIGVGPEPAARDEYHSYVDRVFRLVIQGAEESRVADYLSEVTRSSIGVQSRRERDSEAAHLIFQWCERLREPTS